MTPQGPRNSTSIRVEIGKPGCAVLAEWRRMGKLQVFGAFPEASGKEGVFTKYKVLKVPRAAWCNHPCGLQTFHDHAHKVGGVCLQLEMGEYER